MQAVLQRDTSAIDTHAIYEISLATHLDNSMTSGIASFAVSIEFTSSSLAAKHHGRESERQSKCTNQP